MPDTLTRVVKLYSLLDCQHLVIFRPPPKVRDKVYCQKCQEYRFVRRVLTAWSLYCGECQWGKNYGDNESGAKRAANKHLLKFPDHSVGLLHNGKVIQLLTSDQPPIPDIIDTGRIVTSP